MMGASMARQPGELFTRAHRPRISNAPLARQHDLYVNYARPPTITLSMFVSVPTGVDRIPCATNHDSHRAAPRCARARAAHFFQPSFQARVFAVLCCALRQRTTLPSSTAALASLPTDLQVRPRQSIVGKVTSPTLAPALTLTFR